ncbi:maleylpyruvate isomerase family mycothiol-dependent enzyme [Rhodococcus sp. NPDC127528]|uniref:maleylpyruvate isomerase family mycothiol-dependent enzyme n=1 Tax=unclassified Rhodococcus (in: high G+C Gram-positive bacteria) TaxID=192944 RepID=UPI0036451550
MTLAYPEVVELVARSQARVEETLATLTEMQARAASALPGWSRGHLVTHLARNADALNRLARGVLDGTSPEMYPGGHDARAAAIEEGADRPVELLTADLRFAGGRVIDALRSIGPDLLGTPVKWRRPVPAAEVPVLRWRELEIHHVDLDLGYTCLDWPVEFVESTLDSQLPELARVAPDLPLPDLPRAELLAWIVGRPTREDLPELPPWPF